MKKIKIGTIKTSDLKIRKKLTPPTKIQKSPKDYNRKTMKKQTRKEINDE